MRNHLLLLLLLYAYNYALALRVGICWFKLMKTHFHTLFAQQELQWVV